MEGLNEDLLLWHFKESYEALIDHILTLYFLGICAVCRISSSTSQTLASLNVLAPIPMVHIELDHSDNLLVSGIELGCHVFVVHQDTALDFLEQYVESHDEATYRNSNKTVLLLMDDAYSTSTDFLEQFGQHPSLTEIMNLLILKPSATLDTIELLTHRFVGTSDQASEFFQLDSYDTSHRTFRHGNFLFPDKTVDLRGKIIRIATCYIIPQVMFKKGEPSFPHILAENQTFEMDGLDSELIVEFCKRRNCTVELILDEEHMWGTVNENKTGNGIIGNLVARQADLGFAGMSSWYSCLEYLTFSKPITRGGVTCITPKPGLLPSWQIVIITFSRSVWLTVLGIFCGVVFTYLILARMIFVRKQRKSVAWISLNVLSCLLQQSTNIRTRTASEVMLSVALLLFALNLSSIYSGKSASLRTINQYEPSIDTIDDLANSGITWLQTHEAWKYSMLLSENPSMKKLVNRFIAQTPEVLHQMANKGGVAFALSRLNIGHFMIGDWITSENVHQYQLMREDMYFEHEVAMATKTWPLMERFDELTMRTTDANIRYFQALQISQKYVDNYVQIAIGNSHVREGNAPHALVLEDLLGGFFALGLGAILAMVIFLLEIMPVQNKKK